MNSPKFTPDIDLKDATVIVHLEGQSDMTVKGRFIKMENGFVHIYGHLVQPEEKMAVECEKSTKQPESGIRSYMNQSAMVRFMHEGRYRTGAITHVTDKAWRIINQDLGVTWVPKTALRWSSVAGEFCVVDENYFPEFTNEISEGMDAFPTDFNPENLIDELYK